MIGWLMAAVQQRLLDPQLAETVDADHRCTMALNTSQAATGQAMATSAAELRVESGNTRPLSYEIGGAARLRHTVTISLQVTDGDALRGDQRRDAIVSDLILRLLRNATLNDAYSEDGLQELSEPMGWEVDYTPLGTGLPASYAVLTLTADVDLASLRGR